MERGLKAAALFALIVVASADRALLAGKPSGGALHAVAVTAKPTGAATAPNYFITNGNGTWTYAYYSNNGVANGNAAGQGGVSYENVNSAYSTASGAVGTVDLADGIVFTKNVAGGGDIALVSDAAINGYGTGLNAITFPSRNLGVAVGAMAVSPAAGETSTPNIIITIDGGLSWMAVTGLPTTTVAPGSITAATAYPAESAGDLAAVHFASKSVGWAVGGNALNAVGTVGATQAADALPAGVMYMTTNGATVWKKVPLFYSFDEVVMAATVGATAQNALFAQFVPGFLFGIHSDAAGKNVYAVGSPGMTGVENAGDIDFVQKTTPTILYSGNAGASWAAQTAPATSTTEYGLYSVQVLKGTTAYAVGGSMLYTVEGGSGTQTAPSPVTYDAATNGQIIYTTNGGFSWAQAVFPGNSGIKAPVFTTVALNGNTVWVGGYTKMTEYYPTAQVLGNNGVTAVNGQGYSVLMSTDGKTFMGAATWAAFPAGFIQTSGLSTSAVAVKAAMDVYGITWDNNVRGYIFGLGYIMSTNNGGKSWIYETPADIVTGTSVAVKALANVPTSY